jgi:prolyl-tRNA editing enzyme YbaK/EbsC (Cys-tRNA(Pro) deacylase)
MDDILKLLKSGTSTDEVLAFSLLVTKDKQYFKSLVAELKKRNYSLYLIEKTEELSRLAR